MSQIFLVFGNQLFDPAHLSDHRRATVVMVEDPAFCRRYAFHKQKLTFVLASMRGYAAELRERGFDVRYHALEQGETWRSATRQALADKTAGTLRHFALESPDLTRAIEAFASEERVRLEVVRTPMFLSRLDEFAAFIGEHGPSLQPFYRAQRIERGVLIDARGEPVGGRWSFDHDNRKKLPRDLEPAAPARVRHPRRVEAVKRLVEAAFPHHPGTLDSFWLPTTRTQAEAWLDDFLAHRFARFGAYEDALTERSPFVYHSGLAPLMNVGLLTPTLVLDRALDYAAAHDVPINSLEGFVRQILGWREFVRGVFHCYYEPMQSRNIWNADRRLTDAWYQGSTGLTPMDHVIGKTLELGWAHHIERLMVAANLMNLSGIAPQEVYRWFMEMFVDAYDWVMVPNVFGMGLTSEGGIFTTKPYICGSNYVLKMGDFKRGPWCDVMDGLLWRFVAIHEETLRANQRLAPMVANLPRVARRRPEIFSLADEFIEQTTRAA